MMISKELLSEIYSKNIEEVHTEGNKVYYYVEGCGIARSSINTHELAHKCKKWAWTKNYEIVERKTQVVVYKNNKRVAQFIGDSLVTFLPNRVYGACEWILEQKAKS